MEINEDEIYTTSDIQKLLKINQNTTIKLLKNGQIRAARIGKQYRISGRELLRLASPKVVNSDQILEERGNQVGAERGKLQNGNDQEI